MKILLGTVVIALMLGAGTAFATDDDKTYPGTACVPAKPADAADYKYTKNGIKYVGSASRGTVDCHLLRDRVENGYGIETLNIYVNKKDPGSPELTCTVSLRNLQNGANVNSDAGTVIPQGNGTISFSNFSYNNNSTASVNVRCKLPNGSRIHGIAWAEALLP